MDIDLGSKPKYNIKVNGQSYPMDCPTVIQAQSLKDELDKKERSEISVFLNFVVKLGLPKEVAADLAPLQLVKLGEGLLGDSKKK